MQPTIEKKFLAEDTQMEWEAQAFLSQNHALKLCFCMEIEWKKLVVCSVVIYQTNFAPHSQATESSDLLKRQEILHANLMRRIWMDPKKVLQLNFHIALRVFIQSFDYNADTIKGKQTVATWECIRKWGGSFSRHHAHLQNTLPDQPNLTLHLARKTFRAFRRIFLLPSSCSSAGG